MRRLFLGSVALAAFSTSALAADLPSRRAPPVFVAPVPIFTWTGAYVGINAGYMFDNKFQYRDQGRSALTPASFQTRHDGFTGGGQIGYNYAIEGPGLAGLPILGAGGPAAVVLGVEADAAYTDNRQNGIYGNLAGATTRFAGRTEYLGTARGRLGLALGTVMVYGTGGFAYAGWRDSIAGFAPGGGAVAYGSRNTIRTGAAYGGGIEYAIPTSSFLNAFNVFGSSAVTLKAEYLHYELGNEVIVGTGGINNRVRIDGNLVRAGLNYKLNLAPAPVVARY